MKELPVIVVKLVHIQGPLMGQIQEFTEDAITIGRHPSCSVQFPTDLTTISRNHAELLREGNRYKVVDRSTNGTFVNGKRVTEAFLKDGDVIMFTEGGPKVSYLAEITDAVKAAPSAPAPPAEPVEKVPAMEPARPAAAVPPAKPFAPAAAPKPAAPQMPPVPPVQSPPAPSARQAEPAMPVQEAPKPSAPSRQTVQKVQAPLIVQFGPMLKSYKELPIIIGKKAGADFVLGQGAIADEHAQIFFSQGQYWIRDLTGRSQIYINNVPIGFESALKAQDIISLTPTGPALRFLGEGRLAEYEEAPSEEAPLAAKPARPEPPKKASKSIFDIFKK